MHHENTVPVQSAHHENIPFVADPKIYIVLTLPGAFQLINVSLPLTPGLVRIKRDPSKQRCELMMPGPTAQGNQLPSFFLGEIV